MSEDNSLKAAAKRAYNEGKKKVNELQDTASRTKVIIFPKTILDIVTSLANKYKTSFEDILAYAVQVYILLEAEVIRGHKIIIVDQNDQPIQEVQLPH